MWEFFSRWAIVVGYDGDLLLAVAAFSGHWLVLYSPPPPALFFPLIKLAGW